MLFLFQRLFSYCSFRLTSWAYGIGVCCFAMVLCFFPSYSWGYSTKRSIPLQKDGQQISTTFTGLPKAGGRVLVKIALFGDYDESHEYVDVLLEGRKQSRHTGGDAQCNTTLSKNIKTYTLSSKDVDDGKVQIQLNHSATVSRVLCASKNPRVEVEISYTTLRSPELYLHTLNAPSSVTLGQKFDLFVRVRNQGLLKSGTFFVAIYYGASNQTTGLLYLGNIQIQPLGARSTSPSYRLSVAIPKAAKAGKGFIHAHVDVRNDVFESDEKNNRTFHEIQTGGGGGVDLTFSSVKVNNSMLRGSKTSITFYLQNKGGGSSPASEVRISFGKTSQPTSLTTLGTFATPALPGGTLSKAQVVSVLIPNSLPQGTGYIHFVIDPQNKVKEIDETNNHKQQQTVIFFTSKNPDLVMHSFSVPKSVQRGKSFKLTFQVRNQGGSASLGCAIFFYYSNSSSTSGLRYLTFFALPALKASTTSSTYTKTVTLPTNASPGTNYIHYTLDHFGQVTESNENNNKGYTTTQVQGSSSGSPDLKMNLFQSPASIGASSSIALSFRLENAGTVDSTKGFTITFYYGKTTATSQLLTLGSYYFSGTIKKKSSTSVIRHTLAANANIPGGSGYIHYFIDSAGQLSESNKTNNRGYRGISVQQSAAVPNLLMDTWSLSSTADVGGKVTITFRVKNSGGSAAKRFRVNFYYGESQIPFQLVDLGATAITGVPANKSGTDVKFLVTIPKTARGGTRYIHYYVDSDGDVRESDESDNRGSKAIVVTSKPDLSMELTTPQQMVRGASVPVTFRVKNSGNVDVGAFKVELFYGNASQASGMTSLGLFDVAAVKANQVSRPYVVLIKIPTSAQPGTRYIRGLSDAKSTIKEIDERNNDVLLKVHISSQSGAPDLKMESLTLPKAFLRGERALIKWKLRNAGNTGTSGSFAIRFYYGATTKFQELTLLGSIVLSGSIAKGQVSGEYAFRLPVPGRLPEGSAYLHYYIDADNKFAESDESNNLGSNKITLSTPSKGADLQSSHWSAPVSLTEGSHTRLSFPVKNAGSLGAGSFKVSLFFSTSSTPTGQMILLGSGSVNALQKGSSVNLSIDCTIPSTVSVGSGFLHYFIDSEQRITEVNEKNNRGSTKLSITAYPLGLPDLTMSSFTAPSQANAGSVVKVTLRVKNAGSADAQGFRVHFYYGYSQNEQKAQKIASLFVNGTKKGATSVAVTYDMTLPSLVYSGRGYLHYFIDGDEWITEENEQNNRGFRSIQVTAKPDLQMDSLQIPGVLVKSAKGRILFSVKNAGVLDATACSVSFYYGATAGSSGRTLLWKGSLAALKAGEQSTTQSFSFSLPKSATGGLGYIHYELDSAKQVSEGNELNNSGTQSFWIQDSTGLLADLQVSSISLPSSVALGKKVSGSLQVKNAGKGDAEAFVVQLYTSEYKDLRSLKPLVKLSFSTLLSAGQSATLPFSLTVPSSESAANLYIHYHIDAGEKVPETDELNNWGYRGISLSGLSSQVDLVVNALDVPVSAAPGEKISVGVRIRNQGTLAASGVTFHFYYGDTKSSAGWVLLSSRKYLSTLQPGAYSSYVKLSVDVPGFAQVGNRVIGLVITSNGSERTPSDNRKTGAIRIAKGSLPDLTLTSLSIPKSVQAGGALQVRFRLRNTGKVDAGAFVVHFYLGGTSQPSGLVYIGNYKASGLGKSSFAPTASAILSLPGKIPGGKQYLHYHVDAYQEVAEDNESNNRDSEAFQVTGTGLDLQLLQWYAPPSAKGAGERVVISFALKNTGSIDSNGFTVSFYYSHTSQATGRHLLGSWHSTGLSRRMVTGIQTIDIFLPVKAEKGKRYLHYFVDSGNQVSETDEKNNQGLRVIEIIEDLSVDKDKDGSPAGKDCNDRDKSIFPGAKEVCDGKDNDCDGKVDNQSATKALARTCQDACHQQGTQECMDGRWRLCRSTKSCEKRLPEPPPADTHDAGPEKYPDDGTCYTQGCPTGQQCQGGKCVKDPCDGVKCSSGEFCREGQCVESCDCTKCPKGELCKDGQCQKDLCFEKTCGKLEKCDAKTGKCVKDNCAGITCGPRRICSEGKCIADPCNAITCPGGQKCRQGQCFGTRCGQEPGSEPSPSKDAGNTDSPTEKESGTVDSYGAMDEFVGEGDLVGGCSCRANGEGGIGFLHLFLFGCVILLPFAWRKKRM